MNITIVSHEFPPALGGAGSVAYIYALRLNKLGYNVTVITKESRSPFSIKGVKFKYVSCPNRLPWLFYRNACKSINSDIVILNDTVSVLAAGLWFSDEKLKKSFVFLQGSEPELFFTERSLVAKIFCYKSKFVRALLKCKRIISVSHFMKKKFLFLTELESVKDKISVHYTPVNKDIFYSESQVREQSLISYKKRRTVHLLTVSRVVERKGYIDMLTIFQKLVDTDKSTVWKWSIVGDGSFMSRLIDEVSEKGLSDNICFYGRKKNYEIVDLYRSASLFWLLSNYDESYGLVYKEAQACGCPAIGRNKSGVIEAIKDGVNGFLVDSNEECYEILLNKKFNILEERIHTAKEDYNEFSFVSELLS